MNRRGTGMALLVKFIMTFVAAWIAFSLFDNNSFGWILTLAIAGTLLNYIIGDLFVLPTFGNITATIGDGILAAFTAYVLSAFAYTPYSATTGTALLVFGVLIAVGEYFFHRYLINSDAVEPPNIMGDRREPDFSVEAGEEFDLNNQLINRDENNLDRNETDYVENNSSIKNDITASGVNNTYNMDFDAPQQWENESKNTNNVIDNNKLDNNRINNTYNMDFNKPTPTEFEKDNDMDSSDYK